jgi:ubiquinone/menaquinone biosynthesis C-methylase UbiE
MQPGICAKRAGIFDRQFRGSRELFCSVTMTTEVPTKRRIAAAFSAKAKGYRTGAFIQRQILTMLVPHVEFVGRFRAPWLDAGCGAGGLCDLLKDGNIPVHLMQTDLGRGTLRSGPRCPAVQSDIEALPFASRAFGGVVASSVLHWLADPAKGLAEIQRVLVPGGALVFSMFTKGSFGEVLSLRLERNRSVPVILPSAGEFEALLQTCGFRIPRLSTFSKEYYFASALDVLKYMSGTGTTAVSGRLFSPREILELCRSYEDRYGCSRGVTLSVKTILGTALKANEI